MKIWLLTSEFPPAYGGGISTYCLETARMMSSFGHEVLVITPDHGVTTTDRAVQDNYSVIRFNPGRYFTHAFLGYEANLSYAFSQVVQQLILEEGAPDVVESQEYSGIAYYLLQFKWLGYPLFKDLKVAVTLHAPSFLYLEFNKVPVYQLPYFWIGEMERFCIRAADLLISPSQYLIDQLKDRVKIDDRKIHVLKNPYATPLPGKPRQVQENKIMFFGKLIPQKGCLELLKYFKELWADGFEHRLFMIGGGDHLYHPEGIDMIDFIRSGYRSELEQGKLVLLGSISPDQLATHLSDAHVVLVPSIVDNLPYTVLEAMGQGKVLLVSRQGGQSEMIDDGQDGFVFDHEQQGSFRKALQHVLELSSSQLNQIGQRAIQKVRSSCSYEVVYPEKAALLEQLARKQEIPRFFPFIRSLSSPAAGTLPGKGRLLSVVIPYYNMGKYVEEAVRSVRHSSYPHIEIVIVDDGSNDHQSRAILDTLSKKYDLTVLRKENEGLALARNYGASHAQGDLLAFLDPDDTVEPSYYEKAVTVLGQFDNVFFVGCWAKYFDEATGYWPSFNPEPPYLLFHNMINTSALVYKKEALIKAGLNDPSMIYGMEDYDSLMGMVKAGYYGVALPEPLWNYRVRKNSMARGFTREKQLYLYRLIAEKHKTFFAIFAAEITGLLNANGPGFSCDNPTLTYSIPGGRFLNQKIKQLLVRTIKANPQLRKVAVKLKKLL